MNLVAVVERVLFVGAGLKAGGEQVQRVSQRGIWRGGDGRCSGGSEFIRLAVGGGLRGGGVNAEGQRCCETGDGEGPKKPD
jgi:hypothetical protein